MFYRECDASDDARCEVIAISESGCDFAETPEDDLIRCPRRAKFRAYTDDEPWDDGVPLCEEHYAIWVRIEESRLQQ